MISAGECVLNCRAVGMGFYAQLNNTVWDGTPCTRPMTHNMQLAPAGTRGVCVAGHCKVPISSLFFLNQNSRKSSISSSYIFYIWFSCFQFYVLCFQFLVFRFLFIILLLWFSVVVLHPPFSIKLKESAEYSTKNRELRTRKKIENREWRIKNGKRST